MGARAVDWARLESVCTARYRGFESLPIRFRFAAERRCGIIAQIAESALHASPVIKYVAVYETAAMFIVPYSSGYRRGARFDLLYEPGGRWSGLG